MPLGRREVSFGTIATVLDGLQQRGIAVEGLLDGLALTPTELSKPDGYLSWEDFAAFMGRVEDLCGGPAEMESLAAPGVGKRTNSPFYYLARAAFSLEAMYRLLALWGLRNYISVLRATYTSPAPGRARIQVEIDPMRMGSAPTLRFMTGMLRNLPLIHKLPHAQVSARIEPHRAEFDIEFPVRRSAIWRLRRWLDAQMHVGAALDQVAEQGAEIANQNEMLRDQVAELERVGKALVENQAWLTIALDAAKMGLWSVDQTTRVSRVTPSFLAVTGLEGEENPVGALLGRIHPDDQATLERARIKGLEMRAPFDLEYRYQHPDGRTLWLNGKGRFDFDAAGQPTIALGTVTDVSARKALEHSLRHADRLIGTGALAAGVAHEINNPLTFILAGVEHLQLANRAGPVDPTLLRAQLDEMASGLGRVRDIVQHLSTFSGPTEGAFGAIDVCKVIRDAWHLVAPQLRHQLTTDFDLPTAPLGVHGNHARLEQVFVSLFTSAANSMPERPADQNRVSVRAAPGDDGQVVVEVRDNGKGVDPTTLHQLFDPYLDGRPTGVATGLGLSLCRAIIEGIGGTINATSNLGVGTTFRVVLPGAALAEVPPITAPPVRPALRGRVLVVDDEPLVRRALARMLTRENLDVAQAEDGLEALSLLTAATPPFDAILCDLTMPNLSGVDLHQRLSAELPAVAARMVFVTGGAVTLDAQAFVSTTQNAVLRKPITSAQLLSALQPLLSGASASEDD
jgi:PAS domain S-box-containing protein